MVGQNFRILWELAVTTLVLLSVIGCAAMSEVYMRPPLSAEAVVEPDHGYVAVRVVDTSSATLPINFVTLIPSNVNESRDVKPVRIEYLGELPGSSTLFYSSVPAGRYTIGSLRAFHYSESFWYDEWYPANIEMGIFEVKPGELTDLGSLIYYSKPEGDKFLKSVLRSPGSSIRDSLEPFVSYVDIPVASLTWEEDGNDDFRRAKYISAVRNPTTFNSYHVAKDGSAYFIGKLGYIIKREPGGSWSEDAVDVDTDLTAVAQGPDGGLMVGGEFGALFYKAHGANEWVDLSVYKTYLVESIEFKSKETVEIILWSLNELKVVRANIASIKDMRTVATFKPFKGWFDKNGEIIDSTKVWRSKRRTWKKRIVSVFTSEFNNKNIISISTKTNMYNKQSIFDRLNREAFRYDPNDWSVGEADDFGAGVDAVINAGSEKVGLLFPSFWDRHGGSRFLLYNSEEHLWTIINNKINFCPELPRNKSRCRVGDRFREKIQAFTFVSTPKFFNEDNAIAFVKLDPRKYGVDRGEDSQLLLRLLETFDGGKTWSLANETIPGELCTTLIPDVVDGVLVSCDGISSDFYLSKDKGKTWEHVRQHESF